MHPNEHVNDKERKKQEKVSFFMYILELKLEVLATYVALSCMVHSTQ